MAKKRPHESGEVIAPETLTNHETEAEHLPDAEQVPRPAEPIDPLMDEVQTFLNLRDELSKKLAAEIETLEQKLADLKQTAASLFPGGSADAPEEKKAKKPKPKPPKEDKPVPVTSSEPEAVE